MSESKVKFLEVKTAGSRLVFQLGNGKRVELDTSQTSGDMNMQAMFHGYNQKVRDSAAGFSKEKDFDGAEAAMREVVGGILSGAWNRQGGGAGAGVVMADLATAISKHKDCTYEKALAAVEKAPAEKRAEWMKHKTIAALAAQAKADRLSAAAATDDADIDIEI